MPEVCSPRTGTSLISSKDLDKAFTVVAGSLLMSSEYDGVFTGLTSLRDASRSEASVCSASGA